MPDSIGLLHCEPVAALFRKFQTLGLDGEEERQALLALTKVRDHVGRGEDIVRAGSSTGHSIVLLEGLACRYRMLENGRRQIFTFQYPGDLCDFDHYLLTEGDDAVGALADCSIGVVCHSDIARTVAQYPKLGLALWRGTTVEANILRERLLNVSQRSALVRIAHLLCEQMVRLEAIGLGGTVLPMTQVDLADAASLSVVHMNRTIRDLRELGILSKSNRSVEIVRRDRLIEIAGFDGRYLSMPRAPLPWPEARPEGDARGGRSLCQAPLPKVASV